MELNFLDDTLESPEDFDFDLTRLPPLLSHFRIPRLEEKPQNPIIESLKSKHSLFFSSEADEDVGRRRRDEPGPQGLALLDSSAHTGPEMNLWREAVAGHWKTFEDNVVSWDTFRKAHAAHIAPSFLSNCTIDMFAATRQFINPTYQDMRTHTIHVEPAEIIETIRMTLSGISSPLYVWNMEFQAFSLKWQGKEMTVQLNIAGMDHSVSESFMKRFVNIGTAIRRLESLATEVWQSSSHAEPCIHAFIHAISSVLASIKANVRNTTRSDSGNNLEGDIGSLSSLWLSCADIEVQVCTLAVLCGRNVHIDPSEFAPLSKSAPDLLSSLYRELEIQLNLGSTPTASAMVAYILSSVSEHYLRDICDSVGYGEQQTGRRATTSSEPEFAFERDDIDQDSGGEVANSRTSDEIFPEFFPKAFTQALARSRRSLQLLRKAQPGHPILQPSNPKRRKIRWMWTENEINSAWLQVSGEAYMHSHSDEDVLGYSDSQTRGTTTTPSIEDFALFNLEPGTHWFVGDAAGCTTPLGAPSSAFDAFARHFPSKLPSVTPCLATLTDLVLAPLALHVEQLSSSLVQTFLSPSAGYLTFSNHLTLLRSYVLLTSESFKSRLQSALFSDSPDDETDAHSSGRNLPAHRKHASTWIIGLAHGLTEGKGWPPAGSELSYLLRTVIIDSLNNDFPQRQHEEDFQMRNTGCLNEEQLYEEAEWRLGFAVRDLPISSGQAKWLNPRSIEALDFLYMDYQPPPALEVLLPKNVLSKYHRLFAFNLRLLRVTIVVKALFRMNTPSASPLFSTLASSQKLFQHFRFMASSFVTSLSSYVYDTAIAGNFNSFLLKLTSTSAATAKIDQKPNFSDVFELADAHSKMMDDVLSACLLRSQQKPVGELLRKILETILDFGILMSDLSQGRMKEYQVVEPLKELHVRFMARMTTLIKTLKKLSDRGALSERVYFEDTHLAQLADEITQNSTSNASLQDLLVRLDVSLWWAERGGQRHTSDS